MLGDPGHRLREAVPTLLLSPLTRQSVSHMTRAIADRSEASVETIWRLDGLSASVPVFLAGWRLSDSCPFAVDAGEPTLGREWCAFGL
jgi:hypothetical protein